MVLLTVVLTWLVTTTSAHAMMQPSSSLFVANGEGFIAYLEVEKSFGAIQNCWFQIEGEPKVMLDMNSTVPITTARGELVLPFSATICGIRVYNLTAPIRAFWTVQVENIHGDFEEDYIEINILPMQKTRFDTHVQLDLGRGTISCTKDETYTSHCKIIDGAGAEWPQCELLTTIRPNQTFDCLTYNWGHMKESLEHIVVDIKNPKYTTPSVEENVANTSIVLRCQFVDSLRSCQAELPDHKHEVYIMDGLYNGRYSSYDTLTSNSKCSLEIAKPLEAHEIGLWRIINYDSSTPSGCLFYVGMSKQDIMKKELEQLNTKRVMKIHDPPQASNIKLPEIDCVVPFVIDDCYLRDPNNTVYFPEESSFQRQRLYGKCTFQNMPVIAGIWTCGVRGHEYDKEVLQNIEVIVKPKGGEVLTESLKARRDDAAQLMCVSAFEEPISHCAFIDPQGRVHLVGTPNSIKTAGHVQYYGRGLQHGECGIKIIKIAADDFGQWKCQFIIYEDKVQSTFVMQLLETVIGPATSIGLGVGLSVIIVLLMGVIIGTVFYRRRQMTAGHDFPSADPLNISISPSIATTQT